MTNRTLNSCVKGCIFLFSFLLLATAALSAPTLPGTAVWRLHNARVLDAGTTTITNSGVVIKGYTVVSDITAAGSQAPFAKGGFKLVLEAFSPMHDTAVRKAGVWYIQGEWIISDENQEHTERGMPQNTQTLEGTIAAELPFNPLAQSKTFEAAVKIPNSTEAPQKSWSEGVFNGNGRFEGTLSLQPTRAPRALSRAETPR